MMIVVVLFLILLLQALSFGDCSFCESSCGDWSCVSNCSSSPSNPAFNTYRCAVDFNGNGNIDDCRELPACVYRNGKWVCPTDTGDRLCVSGDWQGPYPYDTDPYNPDADIWGVFITSRAVQGNIYQQWINQYSLTCPRVPSSPNDRFYQFLNGLGVYLPIWICGGALYSDAWLSYNDCSYVSYDGYTWKVKNNDCWNPNKIWQKLWRKCYGTAWSHYIYFYPPQNVSWGQSVYLYWYVGYPPQCGWQSSRTISLTWTKKDGSTYTESYTVRMRCASCSYLRDAQTGQSLSLCSAFQENVYRSGSLLYTLYWYLDTSYSCPVYGRSQSSNYTYESLSPYGTANFMDVLEERPNNRLLRGVGIDTQGRRCRICSTSMYGLSGGVSKEFDVPNTNRTDWDKLAQCANPRFFSGEVRTCRPGGLTTLGATCCGISGWTKNMCKRDEKELKKKRQAGLCSEVGTYCSKRILGVCLERKRSYCCFNSWIARIFNECGRPQVGKGWGSPKRPDCSGFTIDEFSRIDFSTPQCLRAIEDWANTMAQGIEDKVSSDIAGRATDAVQRWINNVKNQKDYGGEK